MEVVLLFNGLGNQMSQYAFYLAKKEQMKCYYIFDPRSTNEHNGYELERAFNIKVTSIIQRIITYIYTYGTGHPIISKLLRPFIKIIREPLNYDYDYDYIKKKGSALINIYIGGWHSEKYFSHIRPQLLNEFTFNLEYINKNSKHWANIIKNDSQSVSIHIRRGDYINIAPNSYYQFNNVATTEYYNTAIKYFKDKYKDAHFYIFSNDIEWCKRNYIGPEYYFIDVNKGKYSFYDMYLITLCKHHINANSTFSWWGAWISDYNQKEIIVPRDFIRNVKTKDLYPTNWIKMDY